MNLRKRFVLRLDSVEVHPDGADEAGERKHHEDEVYTYAVGHDLVEFEGDESADGEDDGVDAGGARPGVGGEHLGAVGHGDRVQAEGEEQVVEYDAGGADPGVLREVVVGLVVVVEEHTDQTEAEGAADGGDDEQRPSAGEVCEGRTEEAGDEEDHTHDYGQDVRWNEGEPCPLEQLG